MSLLFQPLSSTKKRPLDIHELLISNESATFFVRIKGNSLESCGIYDKDILVVDRSQAQSSHQFYIVIVEGDFAVLSRTQMLQSSARDNFEVWGAVTYIIHKT